LSNPYVWEHTAATIAQLWQSKQDFQSSILDTSSSVGRAVIARWRRLNQYSGEEPRQAADYNPGISRFDTTFARLDWRHASLGLSQPNAPSAVAAKPKLETLARGVIASEAKQSSAEPPFWIASSLRSSQ
jgi:hypothetical protein